MAGEKSVWTPANIVTCVRIAFIPVFMVVAALADGPADAPLAVAAFVIYVTLSLTDKVDGYLARSRNEITDFGKFLDPIADKLLTHTASIMLCAMGRLNVVACILFVAREFVVSGLRLVAVEQGRVIAAGMSGKIKTVLQMALVMLLTVMHGNVLTDLVTLAAAAMTLYSMVEYVWQNRAVLGGAR